MGTKPIKITELDGQPLYKVLNDDLGSAHGGTFAWGEYQPTWKWGEWGPAERMWAAGAWTPKIADLSLCNRGYHLTTDPRNWLLWDARVFRAEGEWPAGTNSELGQGDYRSYDKAVFQRVRLLEEVDAGSFRTPFGHQLHDWWDEHGDEFAGNSSPARVPEGMRLLTEADLEARMRDYGAYYGERRPLQPGQLTLPDDFPSSRFDGLSRLRDHLHDDLHRPYYIGVQIAAFALAALCPDVGTPAQRADLVTQERALVAGFLVLGFDGDGTAIVTRRTER